MNQKLKLILVCLFLIAISTQAIAATKLTRLVEKIQPALVTVVVYDINKVVANIGTGFFVDKTGYLVTNYHVLVGKYSAEVRTSDGNTYPIKLMVAENKSADLVKVWVDIPKEKVQWLQVSGELPAIPNASLLLAVPWDLNKRLVKVSFLRSGKYRPLDIFSKCLHRYHPARAAAPWLI